MPLAVDLFKIVFYENEQNRKEGIFFLLVSRFFPASLRQVQDLANISV